MLPEKPLHPEFKKLWEAAGYKKSQGSEAVVPPPPAGFKRLYYLTGQNHAISDIVFARIKIARISELNDPFELLGQDFRKTETRKLIRKHKKELNERRGVICFSEDWTDPVLWSHYAEKHTGFALGFDLPASSVKKIQYSPKRLRHRMPKDMKGISPELTESLLLTKFESWSYEHEWRLVCDLKAADREGGLCFKSFRDDDLTLIEVILGPLCELDLVKIRTLVDARYRGVTTFKARLANQSFQIRPSEKTVPDFHQVASGIVSQAGASNPT